MPRGSGKEVPGRVLRPFCRPRRQKMEGSSSSSFFGGRSPSPSLLSSDRRPILRGGRSKMGGSSTFGSEDRRLKMGGFFDLRIRRSKREGIFDFRLRRTKKEEGVLRRTTPFFEEPLSPSSKNIPKHSIFRAEDWVEDRRGLRGDSRTCLT